MTLTKKYGIQYFGSSTFKRYEKEIDIIYQLYGIIGP